MATETNTSTEITHFLLRFALVYRFAPGNSENTGVNIITSAVFHI